MTTLDKHADVSTALALRLEGAAINLGLTTEDLLEQMLEKLTKRPPYHPETPRRRKEIRGLHAEGHTDTEIAAKVGLSQQAVSRHRVDMGLESNYDPNAPRKG